MNGTLPAVSWLVVNSAQSEHPPASVCVGENWTVEQINAIMLGSNWNSTAIFLTWDDFGGFYDHVPPPAVDSFEFGPARALSGDLDVGKIRIHRPQSLGILIDAEARRRALRPGRAHPAR